MEVIIAKTHEEMGRLAAREVARTLNAKPNAVLGMATGSTPLTLYKELVRMHKDEGLDFSQATTFNLDEYVGLPVDHPQSYHYFMHENFFKHVNIPQQNVYIPSGTTDNYRACGPYDMNLHFIDCIRRGVQPETNFDDATKTMELVDSIYHSQI